MIASSAYAYTDESETHTAGARAAGTNWTNPDEITGAGDNVCATYDNVGENYIIGYYYLFTGPETGDIIDSFIVGIDGYGTSGSPSSRRDIDVGLTKDAGALYGDLQLDIRLPDATCLLSSTVTLDGLGLWGGASWAWDDVSGNDLFGILLKDANKTANELGIDAITVTVWYHTPDAGGADISHVRRIKEGEGK